MKWRTSAVSAPKSWSDTGTLRVVEDTQLPQAQILSPSSGRIFSPLDTLSIELRVSDDTVLHLPRFTVGGQYAGTLGLKTENNKVKPSYGAPRTVFFDYQIPESAANGPMEVTVVVSDVANKAVTDTIVIDIEGSSAVN